MPTNKPLCLAPFAGFVVDTNKGVRPCCTYEGNYFGNLAHQPLLDVLSSPDWLSLKHRLANSNWPDGCLNCLQREKETGWSVRKLFQDNKEGFSIQGWQEGKITYFEFAGSNLCNLACLHCNPGFSTKWYQDWLELRALDPSHPDKGPETEVRYRAYAPRKPQPELILENLKMLDLSAVKTVNFKGGEPFLNSETEVILDYLAHHADLGQIEVSFTTNGTVFNRRIQKILRSAGKVIINISVDGLGPLNEFIRYGPSHTDRIEENIFHFCEIKNVNISRTTSVMAYNLSRLVEIRDWWTRLAIPKQQLNPMPNFGLIVTSPPWLHPCVLTQKYLNKVKKNLAESQIKDEFEPVLSLLKTPYLGDAMHDRWVSYTQNMEKIRNNSLLTLVPELKHELKQLSTASACQKN